MSIIRYFQNSTVVREKQGGTWLELFFDLVYVAILVELGNRLSGNLTAIGVLEYAAMFIPIWWSWLALVFYTRFFPSDDIGQRLLTVLYMGAMILLAFEIHGVTSNTATYFILSYAGTKFIMALMYGRSWKQFPEYRTLTSHHAVIYMLIGAFWIVIAFVAPQNFWLWGIAILLDVSIPLYIRWSHQVRNKPQPAHPPLKHHYMRHRFGELTIIVLGEFFIKLITSSAGRELETQNFYIGACLLLISVSIWWLYFDHMDHIHLVEKNSKATIWIYTHYFFFAAITAYGVVGTKVFAATPGGLLSEEKRLLLCLALAVVMLALGVIDWATPENNGRLSRKPSLNIRIIATLILLLLAFLGAQINVGWLVSLIASVFVIQIGLDITLRLRNNDGAAVVQPN